MTELTLHPADGATAARPQRCWGSREPLGLA